MIDGAGHGERDDVELWGETGLGACPEILAPIAANWL
jgi:hypothetical protein